MLVYIKNSKRRGLLCTTSRCSYLTYFAQHLDAEGSNFPIDYFEPSVLVVVFFFRHLPFKRALIFIIFGTLFLYIARSRVSCMLFGIKF